MPITPTIFTPIFETMACAKPAPDGKIIAAGDAYISGGADGDFALARYNTDGTLDASFGSGGKLTTSFSTSYEEAYSLVVQADGKIIAAGQANISGGDGDFALARYG